MKYVLLTLALLFVFPVFSCKKKKNTIKDEAFAQKYFPPIANNQWETVSPGVLNWDENELTNLYTYLNEKNTKAFLVLKDGKIAVEKYYGTFTADSNWYWASAGKTLTGFMVGIAQKEGIVDVNKKTSDYLGIGWTNAPLAKENLITVRHQLTMTTGIDEDQQIKDSTLPISLNYKTDAGTRWCYFNAPYTLLGQVIEKASGLSYNAYFKTRVKDKIGMNGVWLKAENSNNIFYSTPRSMARFGLLLLNKGIWENTPVLNDPDYFDKQINSSQTLNPSYGYLTWLNGKASYMLPSTDNVFSGSLIPTAPADLYAALGKNDQKIYVVPSKGIVVIRMGNSAGNSFATASKFDNELWEKLSKIFKF